MATAKAERTYYNAFSDYESYAEEHGWRIPEIVALCIRPLLKGGERMLDVGCGPGCVGAALKNLRWEGSLIGVDIAERRLCDAVTKLAYIGCAQTNAYRLCFRRESFDVVVSSGMVGLAGPRSVLEMWRVLEPGGILACAAGEFKDIARSRGRFKKSLLRLRRLPGSKIIFRKNLGSGYSRSSYAGEHYALIILRKRF